MGFGSEQFEFGVAVNGRGEYFGARAEQQDDAEARTRWLSGIGLGATIAWMPSPSFGVFVGGDSALMFGSTEIRVADDSIGQDGAVRYAGEAGRALSFTLSRRSPLHQEGQPELPGEQHSLWSLHCWPKAQSPATSHSRQKFSIQNGDSSLQSFSVLHPRQKLLIQNGDSSLQSFSVLHPRQKLLIQNGNWSLQSFSVLHATQA